MPLSIFVDIYGASADTRAYANVRLEYVRNSRPYSCVRKRGAEKEELAKAVYSYLHGYIDRGWRVIGAMAVQRGLLLYRS